MFVYNRHRNDKLKDFSEI